MNKDVIINQCDVCWVEGVKLNEVVTSSRRGIRVRLLCDECFELYKDLINTGAKSNE